MPKATTKTTRAAVAETTPATAAVTTQPGVWTESKPSIRLEANLLVPCASMIRVGKLVYESERTRGYKVEWNGFGEIQLIELGELVAMKGSALKFFSKNWISIPDSFDQKDEVLKYLGVARYYENTPDIFSIDKLFDLPVADMVAKIKGMPENSKDAVRAAASRAIADGVLDSLAKIHALESALECKLV